MAPLLARAGLAGGLRHSAPEIANPSCYLVLSRGNRTIELIAWRSRMADLNWDHADGSFEQTHFDDLHTLPSLDAVLATLRDVALSFGTDDAKALPDASGELPATLHDWTLAWVGLDWRRARLTLAFVGYRRIVQVVADGVVDFHAPQQRPWGPSGAVLDNTGPEKTVDGKTRLEIRMQTGDVITIVAERFASASAFG